MASAVPPLIASKTDGDDKAGEERYLQCLDTAIQTSLKYGGNVSHHHGVGTAKAKYMEEVTVYYGTHRL